LSLDPLTSCDGFVGLNWTQLTLSLPFSQMSVLLVLLYASPPLDLRLSPGERGEGVGKTVNLTVLPTQRTMQTCKYALP
jgi:hypothetical protein